MIYPDRKKIEKKNKKSFVYGQEVVWKFAPYRVSEIRMYFVWTVIFGIIIIYKVFDNYFE